MLHGSFIKEQANTVKSYIFILAVIHLIVSLAVPLLFKYTVHMKKMILVSDYREFDLNGIINHAKLDQFHGGQFAGDWALVPYYFGDKFDVVVTLAWGVSALCFATCIVLFIIWWHGMSVTGVSGEHRG
jgi:hypothetical protein